MSMKRNLKSARLKAWIFLGLAVFQTVGAFLALHLEVDVRSVRSALMMALLVPWFVGIHVLYRCRVQMLELQDSKLTD